MSKWRGYTFRQLTGVFDSDAVAADPDAATEMNAMEPWFEEIDFKYDAQPQKSSPKAKIGGKTGKQQTSFTGCNTVALSLRVMVLLHSAGSASIRR